MYVLCSVYFIFIFILHAQNEFITRTTVSAAVQIGYRWVQIRIWINTLRSWMGAHQRNYQCLMGFEQAVDLTGKKFKISWEKFREWLVPQREGDFEFVLNDQAIVLSCEKSISSKFVPYISGQKYTIIQWSHQTICNGVVFCDIYALYYRITQCIITGIY